MEKLDVMNLIQDNWTLRALLREIRRHNSSGLTRDMQGRIDAALSAQGDKP